MKNLNLTFGQRMGLSLFLATAQGNLSKMKSLGNIFDAIAFSEEERANIKEVSAGNGLSTYSSPSPDWGGLNIQIEDADAEHLRSEIESRQTLTIHDRQWCSPVQEQLAAASVKRRN